MRRTSVTDGRGVVFDLDGVLVDSEPLHLRAYQEVLGGYGRSLSRQEYYARFIGIIGQIIHVNNEIRQENFLTELVD